MSSSRDRRIRRKIGSTRDVYEQIKAEQEVSPAVAVAAPSPYTRHPVFLSLVTKPYRVVRLFNAAGSIHTETIGEFQKESDASLMVYAERGRARAVSTSGKVVADNLHDIESRA